MTDTLPERFPDITQSPGEALTRPNAPGKLGLGENPNPYGPFVCPRCNEPTTDEYYGPCGACRGAMRQAVAPVTVDQGDRATRRIWRDMPERPTAWVDPVTGDGADRRGGFTCSATSAGRLIETVPEAVRVVMLTRRPVAAWDELVTWAATLGADWEPAGHYLADPSAPVFRYTGPGGRRIELRAAGAWFGDGHYTPTQAAQAWALVAEVIGRRCDGVGMLASPGATGIEAFARGIPEGIEYPTVSDEVAELIRANYTQGRNELAQFDEVPEVVEYDCRWAYAALCGDLPTGPHEWDPAPTEAAYDPYRGGWYRVRAIVPDDWTGLGLIPHHGADGTVWPNRPGTVIDGWVSAVELAQARRWGWETELREAVTFPRPVKPSPLDKWSRRLQAARAEVTDAQAHDDPTVRDLAGAAIRSMLLHAIGSLWAGGRDVTRSGPIDTAEPPPGARDLGIEGGLMVWTETQPPARPDMCHPEWAATIWARCRARMMDGPGVGGRRTGALHVPPETVLGLHTDALYLTADPGWGDDGAIGRLRHRRTTPGPMPGPVDHKALTLIGRAGAGPR